MKPTKLTYEELESKIKDLETRFASKKKSDETQSDLFEKYRVIIDNTSDLIATTTFGLKPIYTYVSPSHKTIMGFEQEDLIGKSGFDYIHPSDRKKLLPILKEYIRMKIGKILKADGLAVSKTIDYRVCDKAGDWHYVQSTVNAIGNELLFVTRDFSERVRSEQALQESEETYRVLIENAPIAIYYNDFQGTFLFGNKRAEEIIGISREQMVGQNFLKLNLLNAEDKARAVKLLALNAIGKPTGPDEIMLNRRDGSKRNVEISTVAATINKKKIVIGMVQDITERKKAEASLKLFTEELQASNRELQQLAYSAGHDLQEPLRMVASYLELLKRRYGEKLDKEADEYIDFAVDGAGRMKVLLGDLLTYSKIGLRDETFVKVDCRMVLEQVLNNLKVATEESRAEVSYDELPVVTGDESQLVQLFQNLISNAIKFHAKGKHPMVHVAAEKNDKEWKFSVRDNGIGIASE